MSLTATDPLPASKLPHRFGAGSPMRQQLKDALLALSLANLCFISAWFRLLYGHELGYFKKPVTEASLFAMAANILWLTLVLWLALRALRRFHQPWFHGVAHFIFFFLLLLPLDFCRREVLHITPQAFINFLRRPIIEAGLFVTALGIAWQHRRVARVAALAVGIFSPFALFTFARIILVSLNIAHLAEPTTEPPLASLSPVQPGRPRVIWIIFDETDQRLAFEQRPAGIRLPEFDCLRGESLFATNAYPPADETIMSMPALISGERITNITVKGVSDLEVTLADTGKVALWSQLPSVFAAARQLGANTALEGWYQPYRRILHNGLNYCNWYPYPGLFPAQQPTFTSAMLSQIGCLTSGLQFERLYGKVCRSMVAESMSLVTNANYGLILLHLPPPHHPGVYLPDKDRFSIVSQPRVQGYFNNLVLADRSLGKLRAALELTGQWKQTWIILSADHSWRRSKMYDGRRDLRVPFLVKPPGMSKSLAYSPQFNTIISHDFILAILQGKISSQQSAVAWLDAHANLQTPASKEPAYPFE